MTCVESQKQADGGGQRTCRPRSECIDRNRVCSTCTPDCAGDERCQDGACLPACEPVCEGLAAHWPLEEQHGALALDLAGGHNGTYTRLSWRPGPLEGSTSAVFSNSGKLVAPGLPMDPPVTFALWVYLEATQAGPLIHLEDREQSTPNYGLQLNVELEGRPQLLMGDGRGAGRLHWSAWRGETPLPNRRWVHLACRVQSDRITFHVDGRPTPGLADPMLSAGPLAHAEWPTTSLGSTNAGLSFKGAGGSLHGALDDVRVYSRALSDSEVRALERSRADR